MKANNFIDKPLWIAAHFGFTPIEAPKVIPADIAITEDCQENAYTHHAVCNATERAAFIRTYIEKDFASLPHPLAVAWKKANSKKIFDYSLELVGFPIGIAEAKLVRTTLSILSEQGHKDVVVELNSIGDKDSILAYERELSHHLRRQDVDLSAETKKEMRDDIWNLLKTDQAEIQGLRSEFPSSIASLTSSSRAHFKEVLEYLEALGIEFRLTPELVGNKNFCSETLFAMRLRESNSLLAVGFRYSRLSKRFGFKKELALMGTTVFGMSDKVQAKTYRDVPKAKFCLVHLGREARMRALPLIELLRQNRIPIYHELGKDKLTSQLEHAERLRTPYLLIVGQKEALDNTVTIRNVSTRAQDTIGMTVLADYLRHISL